MTYSLNEIEMQSVKAARGAGVPWGLAEEAGKAARWLAAYRQPVLDALVGMLDLIDRQPSADLAPVFEGDRWVGRAGPVCALVAGVTLCDRAEPLAAGQRFETGPIAYPLLVVPFVAAAHGATGSAFALEWPGASIAIDASGLHMAPGSDMFAVSADNLVCDLRSDAPLGDLVTADMGGVTVDPALWARLGVYAHRTYVPSSEASRERGAGAGLNDND